MVLIRIFHNSDRSVCFGSVNDRQDESNVNLT